MNNPYQTPKSHFDSNQNSGPTKAFEDLKKVASGQRFLNLAALFYLLAIGILVAINVTSPPDSDLTFLASMLQLLYFLFLFTILILAQLGIYRVGSVLYPGISLVIHLLGAFFPFVGLLVILSANSRATKFLKDHGVKVGLFGGKIE